MAGTAKGTTFPGVASPSGAPYMAPTDALHVDVSPELGSDVPAADEDLFFEMQPLYDVSRAACHVSSVLLPPPPRVLPWCMGLEGCPHSLPFHAERLVVASCLRLCSIVSSMYGD